MLIEQKNMTECSFKPTTLEYAALNVEARGDANITLYSKIKKRQYADEKTISTDEYER